MWKKAQVEIVDTQEYYEGLAKAVVLNHSGFIDGMEELEVRTGLVFDTEEWEMVEMLTPRLEEILGEALKSRALELGL